MSSLETPILLTLPVLERMRAVPGWLHDEEADLLLGAACRALQRCPFGQLVEIGSYCGKSTVVLVAALSSSNAAGTVRVVAIDPHEGLVGAADQGLERTEPTYRRFVRTLEDARIEHLVTPVLQRSYEVAWDAVGGQSPIGFLFVDGLHDYENVSRDLRHFEPHLAQTALVAFHDYADHFPGVRRFVDELLTSGEYAKVEQVLNLIVVRRSRSPSADRRSPETER
jgi:predicted O-methyltransferase YrrM